MKEYEVINSNVGVDVSIYLGARVKNSTLKKNNIVGNFSRVDFSNIEQYVRIDRNNHIYKSLIGKHTYTGMNTVIMHSNIGNFCSISWNVTIGGANHDYNRVTQHSFLYNNVDYLRPEYAEPAYDRFSDLVDIGHDVWIAAGAIITRGIEIGTGAVIGANAVVTKDVPPYAIVVGNPARILKYRFEPEVVDLLLDLKWWDWPTEKIKANYNILSNKPNIKKLNQLINE